MNWLNDLVTVIVALRWILVLIGFAVLGAFYAAALGDLRTSRAELERMRTSNRILLSHQRRRRHQATLVSTRVVR